MSIFLNRKDFKRFWWRFAIWNDLSWSTKSFWHNKPWNDVKGNWSHWFLRPMYTLVSVISLWTNILYRNREPTLCLRKDILRCTTRFYFRTTVVPYLCQRHASGCKIKSIFVCRWLCLMYQHRDVEEIEKQLNKDFENVWDWFVDNKLRIRLIN